MANLICEYCLMMDPNENPSHEHQRNNAIVNINGNWACKGHLRELINNGQVIYCISDHEFTSKSSKLEGKEYEENIEAILENYL